jgi:hypothetical protein
LRWLKRLLIVLAVSAALLRLVRWVLVPAVPALPFDPIAYDGQRVHLDGAVTALKSTVSHRGSPYHFFLLDTGHGKVVVFKLGSPRCAEGQHAIVQGVFHHVYRRGGKTFTDEIDAESINCG